VNVLDYTAVAFPVIRVDKEIDKIDENYQPLNEQDRWMWEQCKLI
jgi:hypothetical protein